MRTQSLIMPKPNTSISNGMAMPMPQGGVTGNAELRQQAGARDRRAQQEQGHEIAVLLCSRRDVDAANVADCRRFSH